MRKSQLKVHIDGVHKKRYVACPHCHVGFHPNAVKRHIEKMHHTIVSGKRSYEKGNLIQMFIFIFISFYF